MARRVRPHLLVAVRPRRPRVPAVVGAHPIEVLVRVRPLDVLLDVDPVPVLVGVRPFDVLLDVNPILMLVDVRAMNVLIDMRPIGVLIDMRLVQVRIRVRLVGLFFSLMGLIFGERRHRQGQQRGRRDSHQCAIDNPWRDWRA